MTTAKETFDWHILDCFCDENKSCALTVFVAGERIHAMADADKLSGNSGIWNKYDALRKKREDYIDGIFGGQSKTGSSSGEDSGVDVSADRTEVTKEGEKDETDEAQSPEDALAAWILQPLTSTIEDIVNSKDDSRQITVQDWYKCPTRFFDLQASKDGTSLESTELESSSDMEKRMEKLVPEISLPKSITTGDNLKIYRAGDLTVISESDKPTGTAFHPCRVRLKDSSGDKTYFLKVVDKNQPEATKREIKILTKIKDVGLHKDINVSVLEGLVAFDDAEDTPTGRKRIMGFIQNDIPDATPLSKMINPNIPQKKRDQWAKSAERLKEALHKHGIVWGDAKADNFLVDKNEDLWIIDFGGSYTEGWVHPAIIETKEGDNMGTEKTVNALRDPINNVRDPHWTEVEKDGGDDKEEADEEKENSSRKAKRKARSDSEEEDGDTDTSEEEGSRKKRKSR